MHWDPERLGYLEKHLQEHWRGPGTSGASSLQPCTFGKRGPEPAGEAQLGELEDPDGEREPTTELDVVDLAIMGWMASLPALRGSHRHG